MSRETAATDTTGEQTREANIDAVVGSFEAISSNDLDGLDDVMAEDVTFSDPATDIVGLEAYKEHNRGILSAVPDMGAEVHELVADDDVVIVYFSFRGTHQGAFRGIEPTGNTVEGTAVMIDRLDEGTIVERTEVYDTLSFFRALGVDPSEI